MQEYHGDRVGPPTNIFGPTYMKRKDGKPIIKSDKERYYDQMKVLFESTLKFLFTTDELTRFNTDFFFQIPSAEFKNATATVLAYACLFYNVRTNTYKIQSSKVAQIQILMEKQGGGVYRLVQEHSITMIDIVRYIRMLLSLK